MEKYILAIDQSTSGTKAILFDSQCKIVNRVDKEHRQITNNKGWVEHDPQEIWENLLYVVKSVIEDSNIEKQQIIGVGIANQRETIMVWDKISGLPVNNAVVWQCSRGEDICNKISDQGHSDRIKEITGLNLSPYFSAAKIAWVLKNKDLDLNNIYAGTVDSWLIYKLTDKKSFYTDYSNASRTQLMDLEKLEWSEEVASYFEIPLGILPKIVPSDYEFGVTDFEGYLDTPIPIRGLMGDSHGALFGQGCHDPGMVKATYGTGSSIMMNVGNKPIKPANGLVSSVGWGIGGEVKYVLEGNINYTGAVMKWIVDDLGLLDSPKDAGEIAKRANPDDTTYLVPAFSGLSAPYWSSSARAVLCGMSRSTKKAEIIKAAEESIALQIMDIVNIMREQIDKSLVDLRVDGGATRDGYLMQFQSDFLGIPVLVADVEELSALGAAFTAGIALGIYDTEMLRKLNRTEFEPKISEKQRNEKIKGWNRAVQMALLK